MGFQKGNEWYKARTDWPPAKLFEKPENLWAAACEYFQWNEENPLYETRVMSTATNPDGYNMVGVPKMRAMTIKGLCIFLGVASATWYVYARRPEYKDVCKAIQDIIYQQKFAGASAGLLNQNIIARELGLKDKKELSGPDDGPVPMVRMDAEQYAAVREKMLKEDDV